MKDSLIHLLQQAVEALQSDGVLPEELQPSIRIDHSKDRSHGDFATNIALTLAKPAARPPREIAQALVDRLAGADGIDRIEIAGPGFINFFLSDNAAVGVIGDILAQGTQFGRSTLGSGRRVLVEFVSANPTGPLHVGHGRGAAYGASVADLLEAVGFEVQREYYVNDAGRQMDILAASVWLRYLDLAGEDIRFPTNAYLGDYVWDIAATLHREHGEAYRRPAAEVYAGLPADEPDGGDKEQYIDAVIARARSLLGEADYRFVFDLGLNTILDDIRDDLALFGVEFDRWYSERSLMQSDAVGRAIDRLKSAGHAYEKDGALWFRSTTFGDEKDRVIVRDNGQTTYFASDIAYHLDKLQRGFEILIDVWGADHHGYVPRVRSALDAMGEDPGQLEVLLVQFANLYRGGEKVQMSTRSGSFVTLRQLRKEVGRDAARYFYVMRKSEQHLDFDLDLAKSQSADNPVYYVQYAHARVSSVFRQLDEKGLVYDPDLGSEHLSLLREAHETALVRRLAQFTELLQRSALAREPHQLVHYLRELANDLHTYYNAHQFLVADDRLRNARLNLVAAVRQVVNNGLTLLGVSAPESM